MRQAFKLILIILISWGILELLAVLFGFLVFRTSVNHLNQIDQSKGKQYNITLTRSQRQANDPEQAPSTSASSASEKLSEDLSQPSSYNATQGQCQDTNGNWKFIDKFSNPMPNDWQPSDGTDYQTHLNPNYKGE